MYTCVWVYVCECICGHVYDHVRIICVHGPECVSACVWAYVSGMCVDVCMGMCVGVCACVAM